MKRVNSTASRLRWIGALALAHLGVFALAQSARELHVVRGESPSPLITLSDTTEDDVRTLLGGPLSPLRRASFWLANNSDRSIVAIATKWSVGGSDGGIKIMRFTADSFLITDARPILGPHSRLLIAPRLWIPEGHLSEYSASPYFTNVQKVALRRTADEFARSGDVLVEVDSVIFSDGEVVGANSMGFDAEIAGRKAAAQAVLAALAQAGASGEPSRAALLRLASGPIRKSDRSALWQRRFARQLLHSPSIESTALYLEHLPSVPIFHHGNATKASRPTAEE
jgi:hypothetical protein